MPHIVYCSIFIITIKQQNSYKTKWILDDLHHRRISMAVNIKKTQCINDTGSISSYTVQTRM